MEKSHVCLVEYLRENYARRGRLSEGLVNTLDRLRVDRHEAIYGLEASVERDQAEYGLKKSEEFARVVGVLLKALSRQPVKAKARGMKWVKEAFPDAGEATFSD